MPKGVPNNKEDVLPGGILSTEDNKKEKELPLVEKNHNNDWKLITTEAETISGVIQTHAKQISDIGSLIRCTSSMGAMVMNFIPDIKIKSVKKGEVTEYHLHRGA